MPAAIFLAGEGCVQVRNRKGLISGFHRLVCQLAGLELHAQLGVDLQNTSPACWMLGTLLHVVRGPFEMRKAGVWLSAPCAAGTVGAVRERRSLEIGGSRFPYVRPS